MHSIRMRGRYTWQMRLTPLHAMAIIEQICFGMAAIARAGWVHRDVSARNVLVFEYKQDDPTACRLKVSDLGGALNLRGAQHRCQTDEGATGQQAPVSTRWAAPRATQRSGSVLDYVWPDPEQRTPFGRHGWLEK